MTKMDSSHAGLLQPMNLQPYLWVIPFSCREWDWQPNVLPIRSFKSHFDGEGTSLRHFHDTSCPARWEYIGVAFPLPSLERPWPVWNHSVIPILSPLKVPLTWGRRETRFVAPLSNPSPRKGFWQDRRICRIPSLEQNTPLSWVSEIVLSSHTCMDVVKT